MQARDPRKGQELEAHAHCVDMMHGVAAHARGVNNEFIAQYAFLVIAKGSKALLVGLSAKRKGQEVP